GRIGDYFEDEPLFVNFNLEQNKKPGHFDFSFGRDGGHNQPGLVTDYEATGMENGGQSEKDKHQFSEDIKAGKKYVTEGPRSEDEEAFELAGVISENIEEKREESGPVHESPHLGNSKMRS